MGWLLLIQLLQPPPSSTTSCTLVPYTTLVLSPMPWQIRSAPLGIEAVHLIRKSMIFASGKDRKPIAQALFSVYRAVTPDDVIAALESFEEGFCDRNTRL